MLKTLVLVNPKSANGSTGRKWPALATKLETLIGKFDTALTNRSMEATDLVREALVHGTERVIAVGGDGTNNEVVCGFFDHNTPIKPQAILGFIPRGTGGDLRRTLGISKKFADAAMVLKNGKTTEVDIGSVNFTDHQGQKMHRLFINITSFGIGGLVDAKVAESTRVLGGKISFMIGTLKALKSYTNKEVKLKVTDKSDNVVVDENFLINNIAIANGQYFGGGMWVAPNARINDGLFDVVILGDFTRFEVLTKLNGIYKGTHLNLPKVSAFKGSCIEASSKEEVLIDLDGEQPGILPLSCKILPKAIKIVTP